MGLFGFVGKALGKVAKVGLGVITHGLSDKVIAGVKAANAQKTLAKAAAGNLVTQKMMVASMKLTPSVVSPTPERVGVGLRGIATERGTTKRRKKAPARRRASTPKRAAARKVSGGPRTPPRGGLDLAAISRLWASQGKPGSWLGFIKANPLKKK